jgi:hypothetical protein
MKGRRSSGECKCNTDVGLEWETCRGISLLYRLRYDVGRLAASRKRYITVI